MAINFKLNTEKENEAKMRKCDTITKIKFNVGLI